MSLKADSLKFDPNKNKIIQKEINFILKRIDDEIKSAHERDEYSVQVSVPIIFSIPNISNKKAQRIIYSALLDSLINRGFITTLDLSNDKTIFSITWISEEEKHEINLQNAILAKYSTKK